MVQTRARFFHAEFDARRARPDNAAMRRMSAGARVGLMVIGLVVPVAPAAGQGAAAVPSAVPLQPNPSECEIQAALLGVVGSGCPPIHLQRPPAPPPAVAVPLSTPTASPVPPAAAAPGTLTVPKDSAPMEVAKPVLKAAFRVEFDFNSTVIRPESRVILDRVAAVMSAPAAGAIRFRVIGHTDAVGGDAANLALSERRALAVVAYLTGQHGIAANRLEATGRGMRELLLPDQPTAAANRRVEIVNLGE